MIIKVMKYLRVVSEVLYKTNVMKHTFVKFLECS
jgi:hypothetical protein